MKNKHILILEVNEKNTNTLKGIFYDFQITSVVSKYEFDEIDSKIESFDLLIVNSKINYTRPQELNELINVGFAIKIPIIYIDNSSEFDRGMLKECFSNGISDYIKKPFDSYEIRTRVNFHIAQLDKIKEYKLRVDKLSNLATQDQLSKTSSKKHMQSILKRYIDNYTSDKIEVSVIYLSLINIDKIVSMFSFGLGEYILSVFSKELRKQIRTSDILSRWYGSEFMILLPDTSVKTTKNIVQKINNNLTKIEIYRDTKPLVAYGILELVDGDTIENMVERAKYTLKEAKKKEYDKVFTFY